MKFEESSHILTDSLNTAMHELNNMEIKFNQQEKELVRTRAILEALRKRPYEFWVAAAYMPGNINGDGEEMIVSSFTLESDLIDFLSDHVDYVTSYEKQTLPLPDVEKMRELLKRSYVVIGALDLSHTEAYELFDDIEEVLGDA